MRVIVSVLLLASVGGCAGGFGQGRTKQYVPVRSSGQTAELGSPAQPGPPDPAAGSRSVAGPPSATGAHEMQPGVFFVTVNGHRRTARTEAVFKWHELAEQACGGRDRYEILVFPVGAVGRDPNLLEGYVRCTGASAVAVPTTPEPTEPAEPPPELTEPDDDAPPPGPVDPAVPVADSNEPSETTPTAPTTPTPAPAPAPAPAPGGAQPPPLR